MVITLPITFTSSWFPSVISQANHTSGGRGFFSSYHDGKMVTMFESTTVYDTVYFSIIALGF